MLGMTWGWEIGWGLPLSAVHRAAGLVGNEKGRGCGLWGGFARQTCDLARGLGTYLAQASACTVASSRQAARAVWLATQLGRKV
jgi:hypothetical protein